MKFSANSWIIYLISAVVIMVVLAQSVYFLLRALKRAKQLGIAKKLLTKTITSSAIFTIAPAISILVGVVVLSRSLGVPLPWLRLSVIGSLSYETIAAKNAQTPLGIETSELIINASDYVTVVFIMTIGIILGTFLTPLLTKKIQTGMINLENRDKKWGKLLSDAMFLGMISAFLGYVFCDVSYLFMSNNQLLEIAKGIAEKSGEPIKIITRTSGLIPVVVMVTSSIAMAICGLLSKKLKQNWITDYALPFSLLCGMAIAIPVTTWLG